MKFRNMYARCLIKKKRNKSYESSVLIRNASELLDEGKISVAEFLDSIAKMKTKQYSKTTTTNKRLAVSSDEDSDDDADGQPTSVRPHTSQTNSSKRARTDCINLCRMCCMKESDVILFPCAHAVICFECWTKKVVQEEKYCVICYEGVTNAKRF